MDYLLLSFNCRLQRWFAHLFHVQNVRIDGRAGLVPGVDGQDRFLLLQTLLELVIGVVVQLEPVDQGT
jgi:hypothetical protein